MHKGGQLEVSALVMVGEKEGGIATRPDEPDEPDVRVVTFRVSLPCLDARRTDATETATLLHGPSIVAKAAS